MGERNNTSKAGTLYVTINGEQTPLGHFNLEEGNTLTDRKNASCTGAAYVKTWMDPPMTRKRFIKLVMGHKVSLNAARKLAASAHESGWDYNAAYEHLLLGVLLGRIRWK